MAVNLGKNSSTSKIAQVLHIDFRRCANPPNFINRAQGVTSTACGRCTGKGWATGGSSSTLSLSNQVGLIAWSPCNILAKTAVTRRLSEPLLHFAAWALEVGVARAAAILTPGSISLDTHAAVALQTTCSTEDALKAPDSAWGSVRKPSSRSAGPPPGFLHDEVGRRTLRVCCPATSFPTSSM